MDQWKRVHFIDELTRNGIKVDTYSPLQKVNFRNSEIRMSGGIVICKYNQELAEYVEDGKDLVFYANNDELVEKVKKYTRKVSEGNNRIKKTARARTEQDYTWMIKFNVEFDKLGLKA